MGMRGSGHGLSERGGWSGSKRQIQTGRFRGPTLPGCLFSHVTVTCRFRSWNAAHSHRLTLDLSSTRKVEYEATFGTFEIDESAHTFTFHVEGALVRTLIGKDLPRSFEFSGKQLIVKSTSADEHWKVTWEHY